MKEVIEINRMLKLKYVKSIVLLGFVLALVLCSLLSSIVYAAPEKLEYCEGSTGGAWVTYGNAYQSAQTFTPQVGHTVTKIELHIRVSGSPGDAIVSLRETGSSEKPVGPDLVSATLNNPSAGWQE